MFPTFDRQQIDSQALEAAHAEGMRALKKAKANGSSGPEAARIAEIEKNKTYRTLTGNNIPGFQEEATVGLSNHDAIGLAEGFVQGSDEERIRAWQLQGSFGRTAMNLIESGICSPPKPMSIN